MKNVSCFFFSSSFLFTDAYFVAHKCLYPGCGKDFSRHDNLGQHMRVHKDYVQEGVTIPNSSGPTTARRKAQSQA